MHHRAGQRGAPGARDHRAFSGGDPCRRALRALLANREGPRTEPCRAFDIFLPMADFPFRHGFAMLPFEAVERALADPGRLPEAVPTDG